MSEVETTADPPPTGGKGAIDPEEKSAMSSQSGHLTGTVINVDRTSSKAAVTSVGQALTFRNTTAAAQASRP